MHKSIRIFTFVLLVFFTSGIFVSCRDYENEEENKFNPQLTIFIHQPTTKGANPDLTSYMNTDLKEVDEAIKNGLSKKANVIYFRSDLSMGNLYKKELTKDSDGKPVVTDKLLKQYPIVETDYTTLSGLKRILSDVVAVGKTEKYGMIIGSHADGWIPTIEDKSSRTTASNKGIMKSFGQGYHGDYDTTYETLGMAIDEIGKQFEFILLDNCYSQNIEVAYDLRNACKYLIGSVTEIGAAGQNYKECLPLLADANYKAVCENYYNLYKDAPNWKSATLSVIDCSYLREMAILMKQINESKTNTVDRSAVQVLDGYDHSDYKYNIFYDLGDYVNHYCAVDMLNYSFNVVLSKLVVANYYTENFNSIHFDGLIDIVDGKMFPMMRPIKTCSGVTCSDLCTQKQEDLKKTSWYFATH